MTDNGKKTKVELMAEIAALRQEKFGLQNEVRTLQQQLAQPTALESTLETAPAASSDSPAPQSYMPEHQMELLSQIVQQMRDAVILTEANESSRICYVNDAFTELYGYKREEVLGQPSWVLFAGDADDKQYLRQERARCIREDGECRLTYHDRRKDGTVFWVTNTLSVVQVGETLYDLGIVRDITTQKQATFELQYRTAELEALSQIGMELTAELELETLLKTIVERAVDLLNGRAGLLGLYNPVQETLDWKMMVGDAHIPETTQRGEGLAGQIWESGEPMFVKNYGAWQGHPPDLEERPIRAVIGAPITWGDAFLGVLVIEGWTIGEFQDADADLLRMFANHAAIALHNAQLFQAEHKQRDLSEALTEAILTASTTLDLDQVLERILEQVARVVKGSAFNIMFIKEDGEGAKILRTVRSHGYEALGLKAYIDDFEIPIEKSIIFREIMVSEEPVIIKDVWQIPGWKRVSGTDYLRAYVTAPIRVHDEIVGFLNVDGVYVGQFDEEDGQRLQAFANHVSVAIEHAQLFEAEHEERKMAEALAEAALTVSSALELERILDRILEQVARVVRGDAFNVTFIEGNQIRIVRSRGYEALGLSNYSAGFSLTLEESEIFKEMKRTGNPIIIPDITQVPRWVEIAVDQTWLHSYVGAPIQINEETVGFLNVDGCHKNQFDQEDAQRLQAFANHVSVAIEQARLFQAERKQRKMAEALAEAAYAISGTLHFEQVLDRILEQVAQVLIGDAFNVMLINKGVAYIARWRGYEQFGTERFVSQIRFPVAEVRNLQTMAETGKSLVISDTQDYEGWEVPSSQPWLRAYIGAPIQIEDETVGYLNVDSAQPHHFTPEDAHRLHVFANYVATAINNARLFHETERRVAELEALQRVALRLTSTLDLSDVLTAVVESVLASTEAYDCHIFLYELESESFTFGAALWRDGRRTSIVDQPRSDGLTAHVVRDGQPIVINDAHQHPFYQTSEAQDWDVHAIAGLPLRWRGHVLGALNVAFLEAHTFTEAELRFLGLLADHAAIAIENAQLHRQVLNHASELETWVAERTQQLQAQYARVEAILNNTSDGLLVTDETGEILHENPVAWRLFNKTLSPEEAEALQKNIRTLVMQRAQRSEQMLELKGLDLQLKVAPILEGGPDGAAVVNIHDITHLNALHRMRAQFISNVSHELRTPTTTIKLYTDLLRDAPPEKRERYLDALVTEVKQQAKLVENILHISRIDAGRLDMQPTLTSLSELTARVVARHQVLAQKAELTLAYQPEMQGPTVLLDSDNFELVISNLIRNAIQYTPAGGQVTITTGKGEHQKRTWSKLTVTDNGIGIPEAELSRIFERFFRGNTPQELQIGGTGLGLAIVKQVVDLHGGHVTVESEVNEGSAFTVWLPLADQ